MSPRQTALPARSKPTRTCVATCCARTPDPKAWRLWSVSYTHLDVYKRQPQQGTTLRVSSTLADADGLGTLSYRWQSSADGSQWADITGASGNSFTPGETQVGLKLRVLAGWTDGRGTVESVSSAASIAVANVNDAPTGTVELVGTAEQGQLLSASNQFADADGLGTCLLYTSRCV